MNVRTADEIDDNLSDIQREQAAAETRRALAGVQVDTKAGAIEFKTVAEIGYMAKIFAQGAVMLPAHLRGNVGACALTLTQAIKWRLDFLFVASQQYVQGTGDKARVNYQSQIFRAIMENSGMLKGRMRHSFSGEGMDRRCKVWATFHGEAEPHEYESPPLRELLPEKNDEGKYKGSPLWERKPDLQMLYDTQRDWVRMYAPDIFGGIYDEHEFAENEHAMAMRDVTPANPNAGTTSDLAERLRANKRRATRASRKGFDEDRIGKAIDSVAGAKTIDNAPDAPSQDDAKTQEAHEHAERIKTAAELGAQHGAKKWKMPDAFELKQPGREAEFEAYMAAYSEAYPMETDNAQK